MATRNGIPGPARREPAGAPAGAAARALSGALAGAPAGAAAGAAAGAPAPAGLGPAGGPDKLPSLSQQLTFIIDNATVVLNRKTMLAILSIVMMEIGVSVILESKACEVDIDLDAVAAINPEVVAHIYNIVRTRRLVLDQPAGRNC